MIAKTMCKRRINVNISFMGGADGPTSFFFAGALGDVILIPVILAVLVIGGIFAGKMIRQKKKK